MVFYCDRGDKFITQKIDALYAKLMEMAANGGGGATESVNKALCDAINTFQWRADTGIVKTDTLKTANLPDNMRTMTVTERTVYIEKIKQKRDSAQIVLTETIEKKKHLYKSKI